MDKEIARQILCALSRLIAFKFEIKNFISYFITHLVRVNDDPQSIQNYTKSQKLFTKTELLLMD